jgi:hypothetical protein
MPVANSLAPRSLVATAALAACAATSTLQAQGDAQPAAAAFDKPTALAGDWIDTDGALGMKGKVAVAYRITGGGSTVMFDFDGGTNLDPAKDGHMHSGRIEFLDADRIRATWLGWDKGKPSAHSPVFTLERRKA